ncbi:MAG: hypothetical protein H6865_08290 [Rhodospirillales bacterium]|nr:hypothetical protein [Alphaproteobacteria bacterium]MCB9987614.1 hypothetical protein [Rhodospirillales bacterium]USO07671.1 MAG: hypothetical protein H6866_00060 [Rhodospirillales bacterium]
MGTQKAIKAANAAVNDAVNDTGTLHYFLAEGDIASLISLESALKILRRQFALTLRRGLFEGQSGYVVSVALPREPLGNVARSVSMQMRDLLDLGADARPVFPGRYGALRGPAVGRGDTVLTFPRESRAA